MKKIYYKGNKGYIFLFAMDPAILQFPCKINNTLITYMDNEF